jgi:hypothetical protein
LGRRRDSKSESNGLTIGDLPIRGAGAPSLTRPLRKILRRIRSGFPRKLIDFVEQRGASATVAAEHKNWHWVEKAHN